MGGGTKINYPAQPSYSESLKDSLQAQIDLAPELFAAEAETRPRYVQLETDILRDTLLGRGGEDGVLSFMGAPDQRFATGDVDPEPWVDPARAQFEQGFAQQQPYQAPWQQQPMDRQRMGRPTMSPKTSVSQPPSGGQQLAQTQTTPTGAIGEGQNQRVRRGTNFSQEYRERFGFLPHEAGQYGIAENQTSGMPRDQLSAAQKWTTAKIKAEASGQPVPPLPNVLQGTAWGDRYGRSAEPTLTWEDVDAGRGAGGQQTAGTQQPAAGTGQAFADRDYRLSQFLGLAPRGPSPEEVAMGQEGMPTTVDMGGGVQVDIPQGTPQADRLETARQEQYGVSPEDQSRMMAGYRPPGYNIDPRTGEKTFGGLAQYGADIAEYGAGRQRAADIRDVGKYGQEATRALREADPLSSAILGRMSGIAGEELAGAGSGRYGDLLTSMRTQAGQEIDPGAAGYGGILGEMGRQAQEGLEAQGMLTARERRNAIQSARQAAEARGRTYDPLALVGELESLEGAQAARRAEQRGFAGQTMAAEEARKAAARQYAANLMQMEAARRGEARQFAGGVMGQSRAMAADPFMAILGRPSGAGQQVAQSTFGGAQYGLSAGPGVAFNPEAGLSYALGQQGNQGNLAAAQAGASAQRQAGIFGALGTIGAAAMCWVAREVYGESNPKWKQFRSWMLNKAPAWFRELYIRNGEQVAESIKDKPEIKARIKVFMDSKLEA